MIKKRADMTMDEIFGLILTGVIILGLIWALFSMLNFGSLESEQAKGLLQNIVSTLNNSNQGDTVSLFVYVPKNWWVIATNPKSVQAVDTGTVPTDLKPLIDTKTEVAPLTSGTGQFKDITEVSIPFEFSGRTVVCVCPNKKALGIFATSIPDCSAKGAVCADISKPLISTPTTSLIEPFFNKKIDLAREIKITNNQAEYSVTGVIDLEVAPATLTPDLKSDLDLCISRLGTYKEYIKAAATANVNEILIKAVICKESTGYRNGIGTSGEVGLMQIMPQNAISDKMNPVYDIDNKFRTLMWDLTAKKYAGYAQFIEKYIGDLNGFVKTYGLNNLPDLVKKDQRFDPQSNIKEGVKLLDRSIKHCGSIEGGLREYNAGTCSSTAANEYVSIVYSNEVEISKRGA